MKVYDISDCQESGRVEKLKEQGADGIILKLGETLGGVPTLDDRFVEFVNACVEQGLPYGVYYVSHASNEDKFQEEAKWINDRLYEYLGEDLPELGIWWDMEVPAVCREDVWQGGLRDAIGTMQSWYEGYNKIGIYAGYSYYYNYLDLDELKYYDIPIWVAQYGYHENSLKAEHPELYHVAWQFTTHHETQDENEWYGFRD